MKARTPTEVKNFIIHCLMMNEVGYISGPPGIGKSEIVFQVAEEFNLLALDIRLAQKLVEDLTGIPSLNEKTKKAEYNPFDTFPLEGDEVPKGYDGWLVFLDELSSASEEIMAAVYSILLDRTVGGKKIHPKARIMAAGNRAKDSAIARELPDTLVTRMLPTEMKVSAKDWIAHSTSGRVKHHQTVVDFISKYPDLLHSSMDPTKREELETYPTPRGWNRMFKITHLHEKLASQNQVTRKDAAGIPMPKQVAAAPITPDIMHLMEAAVGMAAAKSFQEHYDESISVPYPWEVAQSPGSTRIPGTLMGKAKLTSDLADAFIDMQDQSRDAVLQFMNRMDGEHSSLFAQILTEKLGNTASDKRLIAEVKKRLNVQEINVGKVDEDEISF